MDSLNNERGALNDGIKPLRVLCALLMIAAILGIAVLLMSDIARHYAFGPAHQHTGAYPLMLIGLAYIALQISTRRPLGDIVKGLLLGLAFVLWGGEQLLPSSTLVTIMDGAVITIFVVDMSLIIVEQLRRGKLESQ